MISVTVLPASVSPACCAKTGAAPSNAVSSNTKPNRCVVLIISRSPLSFAGMQDELLDSPVQDFSDEQRVLRWARHLVDPAELLELFARGAEHAQDLAVERDLVDAARIGVGGIHHLVRPWRDAERPGCARRHGAAGLLIGLQIGLGADRGLDVFIERHVELDLAL